MATSYTPFQASGTSVLPPNQTMSPGQYISSPSGKYRLLLQPDGNLVIKDNDSTIWVADGNQSYSLTLHRKKMREPLQFVVSNSGFLYDPSRRRLWIAESSHSSDKSLWANSCLYMQDDGNLIIYDQRNGNPCWARFGFIPGRNYRTKAPWVRDLPNGVKVYKWEF